MPRSGSGPDAAATRRWSSSPASFGWGVYAVALLVWAGVGLYCLPILSMVLAPVWMVLWVSVVPRVVQTVRAKDSA